MEIETGPETLPMGTMLGKKLAESPMEIETRAGGGTVWHCRRKKLAESPMEIETPARLALRAGSAFVRS